MLNNSRLTTAATIDFLNLIKCAFVNWFSATSELDTSNDLDSVKLLLRVWAFVVIFEIYCFKMQARCKLNKLIIVNSIFSKLLIEKIICFVSVLCIKVCIIISDLMTWLFDFSLIYFEIFNTLCLSFNKLFVVIDLAQNLIWLIRYN